MPLQGFTLVELVVVILILGILAGVAAPKLIAVSSNATDNTLKQTLSVVRDAIELYAANNVGMMPGSDGTEAKFKSDLAPYIRGQFPNDPTTANNADAVDVQTSGVLLSFGGGPFGWRYDNQAGEFIANSNGISGDGVKRYWEF